jgi:hypothetical protein
VLKGVLYNQIPTLYKIFTYLIIFVRRTIHLSRLTRGNCGDFLTNERKRNDSVWIVNKKERQDKAGKQFIPFPV